MKVNLFHWGSGEVFLQRILLIDSARRGVQLPVGAVNDLDSEW